MPPSAADRPRRWNRFVAAPRLALIPALAALVALAALRPNDPPRPRPPAASPAAPATPQTGPPPPLAGRRPIVVGGEPLVIDRFAAFPALGDIDGDGRDDLLVGDPRGYLHVFRAVGAPGERRFAPAEPFGRYCDDERIPTG